MGTDPQVVKQESLQKPTSTEGTLTPPAGDGANPANGTHRAWVASPLSPGGRRAIVRQNDRTTQTTHQLDEEKSASKTTFPSTSAVARFNQMLSIANDHLREGQTEEAIKAIAAIHEVAQAQNASLTTFIKSMEKRAADLQTQLNEARVGYESQIVTGLSGQQETLKLQLTVQQNYIQKFLNVLEPSKEALRASRENLDFAGKALSREDKIAFFSNALKELGGVQHADYQSYARLQRDFSDQNRWLDMRYARYDANGDVVRNVGVGVTAAAATVLAGPQVIPPVIQVLGPTAGPAVGAGLSATFGTAAGAWFSETYNATRAIIDSALGNKPPAEAAREAVEKIQANLPNAALSAILAAFPMARTGVTGPAGGGWSAPSLQLAGGGTVATPAAQTLSATEMADLLNGISYIFGYDIFGSEEIKKKRVELEGVKREIADIDTRLAAANPTGAAPSTTGAAGPTTGAGSSTTNGELIAQLRARADLLKTKSEVVLKEIDTYVTARFRSIENTGKLTSYTVLAAAVFTAFWRSFGREESNQADLHAAASCKIHEIDRGVLTKLERFGFLFWGGKDCAVVTDTRGNQVEVIEDVRKLNLKDPKLTDADKEEIQLLIAENRPYRVKKIFWDEKLNPYDAKATPAHEERALTLNKTLQEQIAARAQQNYNETQQQGASNEQFILGLNAGLSVQPKPDGKGVVIGDSQIIVDESTGTVIYTGTAPQTAALTDMLADARAKMASRRLHQTQQVASLNEQIIAARDAGITATPRQDGTGVDLGKSQIVVDQKGGAVTYTGNEPTAALADRLATTSARFAEQKLRVQELLVAIEQKRLTEAEAIRRVTENKVLLEQFEMVAPLMAALRKGLGHVPEEIGKLFGEKAHDLSDTVLGTDKERPPNPAMKRR